MAFSSDLFWQQNMDYYRRKAMEHGYTKEDVDSVEHRMKWLYNHRRIEQLPKQIDLLWALHNLLNIEMEMETLLD